MFVGCPEGCRYHTALAVCNLVDFASDDFSISVINRVPTVMEKSWKMTGHGKVMEKSWKIIGHGKVMEFSRSWKKSWKTQI